VNPRKKKRTTKPARKTPKKEASKRRRLASERFKSESRFYNGADVARMGRFTAIVADVTEETMTDGKPKDVLWFQGHEKGVVLNTTNGQQLGEDLGDAMDSWPGQSVELSTAMVRDPNKKKMVPGIVVTGTDHDAEEEEDDPEDDDFDDEDLDDDEID
jgi:hypothetical protein